MGLGFIFSLCGCILFAVNAFILEVMSTSHNLAIAMIFAPMMIHMVGHNLLIPMTLRYALEGYAKVTGTVGSIFGAIYYVVIAAVTYLVSKIHGTISNFASFYCIWILYKKKSNIPN